MKGMLRNLSLSGYQGGDEYAMTLQMSRDPEPGGYYYYQVIISSVSNRALIRSLTAR